MTYFPCVIIKLYIRALTQVQDNMKTKIIRKLNVTLTTHTYETAIGGHTNIVEFTMPRYALSWLSRSFLISRNSNDGKINRGTPLTR